MGAKGSSNGVCWGTLGKLNRARCCAGQWLLRPASQTPRLLLLLLRAWGARGCPSILTSHGAWMGQNTRDSRRVISHAVELLRVRLRLTDGAHQAFAVCWHEPLVSHDHRPAIILLCGGQLRARARNQIDPALRTADLLTCCSRLIRRCAKSYSGGTQGTPKSASRGPGTFWSPGALANTRLRGSPRPRQRNTSINGVYVAPTQIERNDDW